eukprot:1157632-Pelagomonas_calceolata.AAC.4
MSPTQPLVVAGWTRAAALAAAKAAAAAVVGEHAGDGGGGVFSAEEAAEGAGEGDGPQEGSGRALEEGEGEGEGEGLAAGEEGGSGAAHGAQLLQGRGGTAKGGGGSGSVQFMVSAPAMELCADVMATQGGRVRANARYDSSAAHAAGERTQQVHFTAMVWCGFLRFAVWYSKRSRCVAAMVSCGFMRFAVWYRKPAGAVGGAQTAVAWCVLACVVVNGCVQIMERRRST